MVANVGSLNALLTLETGSFTKGLDAAQSKLAGAGKGFEAMGNRMAKLGKTLSIGLTAPLAALAVTSSKAATESAQAMGQVNAALASMGDASGRTSAQLAKSAEGLMKISTFDDDEILQKSTAQLLTFGNVAGEQFDRAQLAAVNLATRMGGDLQGATLMIGKALQSPAEGISKLSRAGIQFTDQQKEMIKGMVASGDAAGAQSIMLAELERQFGGSAEAQRKATPGIETKQAWDNFNETVGKVVNEFLPPLTAILTKVLDGFNNLSPGMQTTVIGFAAAAAAVGPFTGAIGLALTGVGKVLPLLTKLGPAFTIVKAGFLIMKTAALTSLPALAPFLIPLGAIALAAGGVYLAFKNWDRIKAVVSAMVTSVKTWLVDKLGAVWAPVKAGINAITSAFKFMDDKVVRHSYVPDMVTDVGKWMGKLPGLMAGPTNAATTATAAAFSTLQDSIGGMSITSPAIGALAMPSLPANDNGEAATPLGEAGEPAGPATPAATASTGLLGTLERIQTAMQGIGDIGRSAFTDMAETILSAAIPAMQALQDKTATLGQKISAVGNALSTIFGAIFGKKVGRIIGAIGQVGAAFAGFRAGGGPVSAGKSYMVGERGPEMIMPRRSGFVLPNKNLGQMVDIGKDNDRGPSGVTQHFTINAQGSIMASDIMREIQATGMRAAVGGSAMAQGQMARRGRRRLA